MSLFLSAWEPSFFYPLLLLEQFADAPKERCAEDAEHGRPYDVGDAEGSGDGGDAEDEEEGPWASAEVVLGLDDDGVEDADDEEGGEGDDDTCEIHI